MSQHHTRLKRKKKSKAHIRLSGKHRLVVHRSNVHIYSQIVKENNNGDIVLASSSTIDKELKKDVTGKNKTEQAYLVGQKLAKRAVEKGLNEVAFDRAGYKYHGRTKALAEGAREAGLKF